MPRVKSVKSLSKTCMDFILHDREYFCNGKINMDLVDSEETLSSPFDCLPTVLLEELVKIFRENEINKNPRKLNNNESFKLFATHHLRTLDLRHWGGNSNVLKLAALKSPHIEKLMLGYYCNRKYPGEFFSYIPKFSKLKSLDISLFGVGDDCLQLIGIYCPDLRELYAQNHDVSDDGIRSLCVTGNCKSIRLLILEGSIVTIKGIQLALTNLPELQILYHASVLDCLAEIAQSALNDKLDMPQYSLSALYIIENAIYKSQSLNLSVLLCPKVTKIHFVTWGKLTDADLLSLISLKNLKNLDIHYRRFVEPTVIDAGLTFNGSIAPLIKTLGNSLKRLSLKGTLVNVDILTIIESCPNLQSLALTVSSFRWTWSNIEEKRIKHQPVMKKLAILELYGLVNEEILLALLSSPSLAQVRLFNCSTLSDKILHEASRRHSFRNLENFQLFYCSSITKIGIDILFRDSNPIKEIHLKYCQNITDEDLIDWKKTLIEKKNWDVKISSTSFTDFWV